MRFNARYWSGVMVCAAAGIVAALTAWGCRTPPGEPQPGVSPAPRPGRPAPRPMPTPVRAAWVARFHYRHADDVRTIIRNCAAAGFNTVLWQVRGEATVAYPSRLEPWAREYNHEDPGFDPLATAVDEAHRHGLRIEAWVNVTPGWKGKAPPPAWLTSHVWHARPEWFLHDAQGRQQPLGEFYLMLNPCRADVRRHVAAVVEELLSRYDLDGIHLDYVRYAWEGDKNAKRAYPRDPQTLALFQRETGHTPDDNPAAWDHWRANQLTRLVAEIRHVVNRRRPGATLTAAVWRSPQEGYRDYLQNSVAWLRSGLVDALMPMAYGDNPATFGKQIENYRQLAEGRRIVPGVGIYLHNGPQAMQAQMQLCRDWGGDFALFSYESLFPTAGDRHAKPEARDAAQRLRHMRRQVLVASAPPPPSVTARP